MVDYEENETGIYITLRRANDETFEVVTNGHVERVADQEPVAAPHWKDRFWWEMEGHNE